MGKKWNKWANLSLKKWNKWVNLSLKKRNKWINMSFYNIYLKKVG